VNLKKKIQLKLKSGNSGGQERFQKNVNLKKIKIESGNTKISIKIIMAMNIINVVFDGRKKRTKLPKLGEGGRGSNV